MTFNSDGIKTKKENFKALKEEIKNIKSNIEEEMHSAGVFMNDKEEYVWRSKNKKKYHISLPEKRFDINEILKYYELNKDKYLQGFTSKYFRELTDLLTKKKNNKYSKERLHLFNSRINKSHKIYMNHLKKYGEDTEIKSSLNRRINHPFVTTTIHSYNYSYKNNNKNENRKINHNNISHNRYINIHKVFSSNNISTLPYNNFGKRLSKIKNKNKLNDISFFRDNHNKTKINNNYGNNKLFTKYNSYKNIHGNNNNLENKSFSFGNKRKSNSMDINKIDGKEEFFKHLDKDKYFNFLKNQYNFFDDYIDKNKINYELQIKRRKKLFNSKPNNKFFDQTLKDICKLDFFNKIKRKNDNNNSPRLKMNKTNKIITKKNIGEISSLSARFLKTVKFNNDCKVIYEKIKKDIK